MNVVHTAYIPCDAHGCMSDIYHTLLTSSILVSLSKNIS